MRVVAFMPVKGESERLKHKNTREFAGRMGGLTYVKLRQVFSSQLFDEVVLSTDIPRVMDIIAGSAMVEPTIVEREEKYKDRDLPTRLLHQHATETLERLGYEDEDIVVWTQVTNPLFNADEYASALDAFRARVLPFDSYNSLQTVTRVKGFFLDERDGASVNWSREEEGNWPRSQTMKQLLTVDSACSIITLGNFKKFGDRVGSKPFYYASPGLTGWDIDTYEDFLVAELLYKNGYNRIQVRDTNDNAKN